MFTVDLAIKNACKGLDDVDADLLIKETKAAIYEDISSEELSEAMILTARAHVEEEPNYSYVAARLLLAQLRHEAFLFVSNIGERDYFARYIHKGISLGQLDERLGTLFDLDKLTRAIKWERDDQFKLLGLQTLYDRYLIHSNEHRYEMPQAFFMRVAMGLAIQEDDPTERAIEFYELLSSFDFMASTPTLFNSGTPTAQLSSCFLTTVDDSIEGITNTISNNAKLSKFSGGLGNDWTPVRGTGSLIKGTNGKSSGVVPFLKVAESNTIAWNQGGMRKGATCAYLETWHIDIEDFLDLRKNTGDDRRRTHDMNTANWVPDLFMQRVKANGEWTLFSPDEVPELHDSYGEEFERNYISAELLADAGQIKIFKRVQAKQLWRKMLTMLFETGHPWITFKDPINERSPQRHSGVVQSSNLCTEITLNTTKDEVAVCNLGSVNIPQHIDGGKIDRDKLGRTITTAIRMLDNVIDINYYTIPEAERSNMKHRPIGLGMMGFHDALYKSYVGYDSDEAVEFADEFTELYSYYAIKASAELARERGAYQTFEGSLWSKGILPIDTIQFMSKDKEMDQTVRLPEWNELREFVKGGMRNSNVMAIAPTATIANITGVSQGIDPIYQNLYVKSSMSGNFTTINEYLVRDLKDFGLWNEVTREALKIHDGSLQNIGGLNSYLKNVYKTAFEIDPKWLIEAASRRQKWLDQAQSLNLYMAEASGPKLDRMYFMAWEKGLKTTYYLRSQGATHVEKSTIKGVDGKLNSVSKEVRALIEDDCEACT